MKIYPCALIKWFDITKMWYQKDCVSQRLHNENSLILEED